VCVRASSTEISCVDLQNFERSSARCAQFEHVCLCVYVCVCVCVCVRGSWQHSPDLDLHSPAAVEREVPEREAPERERRAQDTGRVSPVLGPMLAHPAAAARAEPTTPKRAQVLLAGARVARDGQARAPTRPAAGQASSRARAMPDAQPSLGRPWVPAPHQRQPCACPAGSARKVQHRLL
jgi:hypothetical protein